MNDHIEDALRKIERGIQVKVLSLVSPRNDFDDRKWDDL